MRRTMALCSCASIRRRVGAPPEAASDAEGELARMLVADKSSDSRGRFAMAAVEHAAQLVVALKESVRLFDQQRRRARFNLPEDRRGSVDGSDAEWP